MSKSELVTPLLKTPNQHRGVTMTYNNNYKKIEPQIEQKIREIEQAPPENRRPSQAEKLIKLITETTEAIFFYDQFKEPYVALYGNGKEVLKIRSRNFKRWLASLFWKETKKAIGSEALQSALQVLEGKSLFESKCYELHNRVARHEDCLWYDLGDGTVVKINEGGWEVVEDPPILFRRLPHQKPQVHPEKGGRLAEILDFVNLGSDEEKLVLQVCIVADLIPDFPHPVLALHGSQGSGKTLLYKLLKDLIDPSLIKTMSAPDSLREFIQLASHHWVIFLDNLSVLSNWLSDAFCRACSGDGFSKRELYSDDDDVVYSFQRILGVNGIYLVINKPDLLDRSILLGLETIPKNQRRKEKEIWESFERTKPRILGAGFDVLVEALQKIKEIRLTSCPRMADFTYWGCAIAKALGYSEKDFLDAYASNISRQHDEAINASPIGLVIMNFMEEKDIWEGTPTELLIEFENIAENLKVNTKSKVWPKDPRWLWRRIQEVLPDLEAKGIKAERGRNDDRNITLRKLGKNDDDVDGDDDNSKNEQLLTDSLEKNDVRENKNDVQMLTPDQEA